MNWIILRISLAIFIIVCLSGCQSNNKRNTTNAKLSITDTLSAPVDSNQLYFPHKKLDNNKLQRDSFTIKWYSSQLFAMKEPIIYTDSTSRISYRFTWLRTFHNPIAIRVENTDNDYFLFWKLCDGAGGYEPGKLTVNKKRRLEKKEWETFINQISQLKFWEMSSTDNNLFGKDGAQWILEGKDKLKYHVVDRWSEGGTVDYYKCCEYLISLTDLNIADKDKY